YVSQVPLRSESNEILLPTLSCERAAEISRALPCRLWPYRFQPRTSAFASSTLSRSRPRQTARRTCRQRQMVRRLYSCALPYFSPTTPFCPVPDQCRAFLPACFPSHALLR